MGLPDDFPSLEDSKRALAIGLVEIAWNRGSIPQVFEVAYEGAIWEVELRLKADEEIDNDFTEKLPE